MHPHTWKRLEDARAACDRVIRFLTGIDKAEFGKSELLQSAVERQLEIIGESLGRADAADPEVGQRVSNLRKIVGFKNRLIHGYDFVDEDIVWDITRTHVPKLKAQIESVLKEAE